jgi:hypothetical protein
MTNNPNKMTDPVGDALSAIDEVLEQAKQGAPAAAKDAAANGSPRAAPPVEHDLFSRPAAAPDELRARRPANDDRESIGDILRALQPASSRSPYLVAALASAVWLVLCGLFGLAAASSLGLDAAPSLLAAPAFYGLVVAAAAPVALFFAIGHMVARSRELRAIAQSMASVAMRLAEPEAVARESIVTVGQAIRREVSAMGDGVERALARAAELETLVQTEVSAIERAYSDNEVRIRGLLEDLARQRDLFVSEAEQVRAALSNVHSGLAGDIASVSEQVAVRVDEAAQRITRTLSEKGESITHALARAGDSMIDSINDRGNEMLERLERTSTEASSAISTASERLTASLNFKTDHIGEEFAELSSSLSEMMQVNLDRVADGFAQKSTAVVDMMDQRSRELTDSIVETSTRLAEVISARADEANNTLRATGESLVLDLSLRGGDVVSKLEQTGARITEGIVTRGDRVSENFRANAEMLADRVGSGADAIKDMLGSRLQAFEEMFNRGGGELAEKIAHDSTTLGNLITRHLAEFDRTVKTYGGELVERLGERTQSVTDAMRGCIDNFDTRVTAKTTDVTEMLDQRLARFQETLDNRTQTLNEQMSGRLVDIAQTLAEGGKEVVNAIDRRVGDLTGTITARGSALAETIDKKIQDIDNVLGLRALEVANNLDSRIGRFEELLVGRAADVTNEIETRTKAAADTLNARLEQLTEAIRTNTEDAERRLVGVSNEVSRNFVGKVDEIAAVVTQRSGEMTTILDASSSTLLAALTEKSQEFTGHVNRATEEAVRAIGAHGFQFTSAMLDNSHELARVINEAGETAAERVNATLKALEETAKTAIERSQQSAAAAVTEMMETQNSLRADGSAMFERLREANVLLQEVLSGAQENMSALENALVTRVAEFVTTMKEITDRSGAASNQVATHVTAFHTVTSKVLEDLSQLAVQFDSHGRTLVQAVDLVDKSNRETEVSLTERRGILDAVVGAIDIRTADLDERLRKFTELLDRSLESAEHRARDIARVVADASVGGVQKVAQQFDAVRAATEEERRRTVDALRDIYEQATGDTHNMLRQTTERFTEVLQGMRHMAGEMQNELDATRSELRRGILELPQETAEAAAQMRRVIVDQIEALAELNRIVARHGRGLDAEPTRRPVREEPVQLATVGGRFVGPRPQRGDTTVPPPVAPMPRAEMLGVPTPRRAESPSLSPSQGGGRSGGWLSDLLHRASRDDGDGGRMDERLPLRGEDLREERQARHTIESLDALSVDIARMIDHDAAAELWDRYNRGERNVFTRRLYTLQGQKTFDEIRKKYRTDREFKQTVDRYIAEFERLLDDVSNDDRGQVVARTYLTSETGKVYTMLAHAAGRFD